MNTMMVGMLFALLVAVYQVSGATIPNLKKNHHYEYNYEGRVATGIFEDAKQHFSGFGIRSTLKVYNVGDLVYFKFHGSEAAAVNTDVDDLFVPLDIPYGHQPVTQETRDAIDEIEKDFAAEYDDGVFKLFYDPGDRFTNWRRSVVSLFQTQFHPKHEHDPHFYKVDEDGVGGKCKTVYKIAHISSELTHSKDVLNVTKVRLYDECEHRPHYFFTSLQGGKCSRCNKEFKKPLHTHGRVEYQIKGNKQQFTIQKILATGVIAFTPFTTHGQSVMSFVNQTLSLVSDVEVSSAEVPPELNPAVYHKVESLSFQFYPETVPDGQEINNFHHNRVYKKPITDNSIEKLQLVLDGLVKAHIEGTAESDFIMKIIYRLGEFDYEHFEELFEKTVKLDNTGSKEEIDTKKLLRFTLLEILPYIGTKDSVTYMFHLIEHHLVDKGTASEMMSRFPFYVKDFGPDLLDKMQAFINKDEVKDYLKTWNAGLLAYGVLVRRSCVNFDLQPHTNGDYFRKHPELCKKYVQDLKDKFYQVAAKNPKDAIVYLIALRATRHPDGYEVYMDVAKNEKYPLILRQRAIWGAVQMVGKKPEEIAALVTPLFFDYTMNYAMRIYAFEILLEHFSTQEFISSLIISLAREPNEKVASYVFSYLETMANTTDPCYEFLNEKARYILSWAKPRQDYDVIRHGSNRIFSAYNAKYNFGRKLQVCYIPSERSFIPRELFVAQSINILGYDFTVFEAGVVAEEDNALTSFSEYFGPGAIKPDHEHEHGNAINDIVAKLGLDQTRNHVDDSRYGLFIATFGQIVKFSDKLEHHDTHEVVVKGNVLNYNVHSVNYAEAEYIIPNEMGFPVVLSVKVPATVHLDGEAVINPSPSKARVEVDGKFRAEFYVNARMFVYTPTFAKSGYQLHTTGGVQFPLKGHVDYDTESHKFEMKYVPSTKPYEIFHYSTIPSAISPIEPHSTTIKYSENPVKKEYKVGHNYFGVGLKYNFQYDYKWNDYGSYRDFFKSFFHKDTRYEDFFLLADKYYAGTRGFVDYAIVNPSAKPFDLSVTFEPSEKDPTQEFLLTCKCNQTTHFEETKGQRIRSSSISLVAHGREIDRKWEAQMTVSDSFPESDFRKAVFHYERSPIPNHDEKKFEVHYKSDVTYVNYMTVFTEKPEEVAVKYNGKLTIGNEDAENSKVVKVKMLAEQTEEHKTADKTNVWYYKKCKEDLEHHAFFTDACWRVMKDSARIDKITFDFDYKNFPPQYKVFANRLYSWFRHSFYNNLYIDYFHGSKQENHVNVMANFSYHYPVFDLKVTRPDQTVYYKKVYAPSVFPKYQPFNIAEDSNERYMSNILNYQTPRCFVTGDRVHTFDGLDYLFNEEHSKCYHLVMGDCRNHHFLAFVKEVDNPKMTKAMKLYFHGDVFEAVPNAAGDGLDLSFNQVQLHGAHGFILPVTSHPNYKIIVSLWGGGVHVQAKDYGVEAFFEGSNTCFVTNNFYRGKQCGLCGDLDGESFHDLKKPDGVPVSPKEMNEYYRYKDAANMC